MFYFSREHIDFPCSTGISRHIPFSLSSVLNSTCMSLKACMNFSLGCPVVITLSVFNRTYHIPYVCLSNFNFSLNYPLSTLQLMYLSWGSSDLMVPTAQWAGSRFELPNSGYDILCQRVTIFPYDIYKILIQWRELCLLMSLLVLL